MIVPSFIMVAAAYASTLYTTVPSAVIMQESWNNVRTLSMSDALSHSPFVSQKTIITIKRNKHNFDVNLGQIGVENQEWSQPSLTEVFDLCGNLNVVRAALKHCCKQTALQYSIEQTVLSFYDTKNFKNGFTDLWMQENASHVEVETPASVSEASQETIQLYTRKAEQTINIESLPVSLEEDAFTHKESGAHDAFTADDSSLEREQE
ncbi:lytic transglycosylase domain-containing protein [Bartonella saheliensis]|uniref:lytic transglycosylase domain-containing protein n=1 Tax=Bartonella saheliensis TaxID=1457016 RepID=UPI0011A6875B|nr:lytic transglycosylase domain-containing protein [Bartonella saheliensis]